MRRVDQWLRDYGASHQNRTNKRLHWVCVPVIVWCVIALLWRTPIFGGPQDDWNWSLIVVAAALLYYASLSVTLALGALVLLAAMLVSIALLQRWSPVPLWQIAALLFVLAWIGQFLGHRIEGKRPSFFQDLQFLLIGPLWLLADVYRRFGIPI